MLARSAIVHTLKGTNDMGDGGNSHDPNQDGADAVKQRGMDTTVDLTKAPSEQKGVQLEQGPTAHGAGDDRSIVKDDVEGYDDGIG
jgi:hypothetical protein